MDGQDFLLAADHCLRGPREADWRSAVSRAYYAVFHYFRQVLEARGTRLGKAGSAHNNLYLGLFNCGLSGMQPIGRRVGRLGERRADADYDMTFVLLQADAGVAVQEARDILNDFQALMTGGLDLARLAADVKAYLVRVGRLPP
jgi:uncharacterized protein (UPF0332 family)